MATFPVVSNLAVKLQAYAGGPGFPGTPQPLGTAWLTSVELIAGTTQVDASLIPALQSLLAADPPSISRPGLTISIGGVTYSF